MEKITRDVREEKPETERGETEKQKTEKSADTKTENEKADRETGKSRESGDRGCRPPCWRCAQRTI